MTETPPGTIQTSAPAMYKRLMAACGIFAGLSLGVGAALNRPFIAVGLYVVGMAAAVMIPYTTAVTLFDERDDA